MYETTVFKPFLDDGTLEFVSGNLTELRSGKLAIFETEDGEERVLEVDMVMFATGYEFNYPYLHEEDGLIRVDETKANSRRYIYPLYKNMFSITDPHFIALGIP